MQLAGWRTQTAGSYGTETELEYFGTGEDAGLTSVWWQNILKAQHLGQFFGWVGGLRVRLVDPWNLKAQTLIKNVSKQLPAVAGR